MKGRPRIRPWVVPLAIGLVVSLVGWWAQGTVERAIRDRVAEQLVTVLDTEVAALRFWFDGKRAQVEKIASLPGVEEDVTLLNRVARTRPGDRAALVDHPSQNDLRVRLEDLVSDPNVRGYAVLDRNGVIVAALQEGVIGGEIAPLVREGFVRARRGETVVAGPLRYPGGETGDTVLADFGAIFVASPVQRPGGTIVGVLALRYAPEDDLSRLLALAKLGATGQSYAFNGDGLMVSESRFAERLSRLGIVQGDSGANTILHVHIRNPGRDLTVGGPLAVDPSSLPLTKMAAEATAGRNGADLDGYADFRGVPVVGAWRWIPEYGLGVATEMEVEEAYQTLYVVRRAFWALVGLLVLGAFGAFIYTLLFHDLSTRVRKAEKLGQYTLEERIGEGGMGAVYRARHAMLRRPTAIKLIKSEHVKPETLVRFEREVQLTSQLSNPNTVAIYDFGRTPDGVFYYAMEYLPGITLEALVAHEGPLPERRVVHLLRQVSSSLAEAHAKGLIHRDIKPANIMVLERGGLYDVVKVLDFGLVKEVNANGNEMVTAANTIPGTPHFLSPEAIEYPDRIDARSDLYALGAVGYHLLTGTYVFSGRTPLEVLGHHLRDAPKTPSARLGRRIDPYLEALIMRLLAKDPADRPAHAGEVVDALSSGFQSPIGVWTQREAAEWWRTTAVLCRSPECDDGEMAIDPTLDIDVADRVSDPTP